MPKAVVSQLRAFFGITEWMELVEWIYINTVLNSKDSSVTRPAMCSLMYIDLPAPNQLREEAKLAPRASKHPRESPGLSLILSVLGPFSLYLSGFDEAWR